MTSSHRASGTGPIPTNLVTSAIKQAVWAKIIKWKSMELGGKGWSKEGIDESNKVGFEDVQPI